MPRSRRILVAEDDADTRFMLATALRLTGYEVTTADCVAEAEALAREGCFNLFILDNWFRDGGSGVELCGRLVGRDPRAAVIIYSAAAFDRDREAGLRAGARAYVAKPAMSELRAAVSAALSEAVA
ncbi:MAG: response regulator [Acidobacteria bacterium]|nr:response regulator [Acidobacteriota bacterium]